MLASITAGDGGRDRVLELLDALSVRQNVRCHRRNITVSSGCNFGRDLRDFLSRSLGVYWAQTPSILDARVALSPKVMRILFYGDSWFGSNARSCAESLTRLGHDVLCINEDRFLPQVRSFTGRLLRRLLKSACVREINDALLEGTRHFSPDIFIAFKGTLVRRSTLRRLSSLGVASYNYFPDTSAFQHGPYIPETLPEYDAVFYTKPFWYGDVSRRLTLKAAHFIPHGYDPELHRAVPLSSADHKQFDCDVSLIATHTPHKETVLRELLNIVPELDLGVWGPRWQNSSSPIIRRCIRGYPLLGQSFARAIQCSKINLAIMSGAVPGASSGDNTTSRTYIIPAAGGFMLHERNHEVVHLFQEDKEIVCFSSPRELASKISHYLLNSAEREEIAAAGRRRCVPAYSYDCRMAELIKWHQVRNQPRNPPTHAE